MDTVTKGNLFEDRAYAVLEQALAHQQLGLTPRSARIFQKQGYFSRDRGRQIITDISIEVFLKNATNPSILWIFECKDYDGSLPVNEVEEFHAKLEQIGRDNTKGTLITNAIPQRGAINYAKSNGIGIIRLLPDEWKVILPVFAGIAVLEAVEAAEGVLLTHLSEPSGPGHSSAENRVPLGRFKRVYMFAFFACVLTTMLFLREKTKRTGERKSANSQAAISTQSTPITATQAQAEAPVPTQSTADLKANPISPVANVGVADTNVIETIEDSYYELDKVSIRWLATKTGTILDVGTVLVEPERLFLITGNPELLKLQAAKEILPLDYPGLEEPLATLISFVAKFNGIAQNPRSSLLTIGGSSSSVGTPFDRMGLQTASGTLNEDVLRSFSEAESVSVIGHGTTEDQRCVLCKLNQGIATNIETAVFVYQERTQDGKWESGTYVICPPVSVERLEQLAKAGNANALVRLARIYLNGRGVEKNTARALDYYATAAKMGHGKAQSDLGQLLLFGKSVPHDPVQAAKLLTQAANQQSPHCQLLLGKLYLEGAAGVPIDEKRAMAWLREAAAMWNYDEAKQILEKLGKPLNQDEYYKERRRPDGKGHFFIKPYDGID